jgi:hypothetical protein
VSVPYRTSNYSDYLSQVSALIGVDQADLQTTELTFLNVFFDRAVRKIWESQTWRDLCPYGEVRFPTNSIAYPNDLSQSVWVSANAVFGGVYINNPLDNRLTASYLSPSSGSFSSPQGITQAIEILPAVAYQVSGYYAIASGGGNPSNTLLNYLVVAVGDGNYTYTAGFNCLQPNPAVVGTSVSVGGVLPQAQVSAASNGFVKWSLTFTSTATALGVFTPNLGSITLYPSPDGVTTSYTGNPYATISAGGYSWGVTCYPQTNQIPDSYLIPWSQPGESAIDTVFDLWGTDPGAAIIGQRLGYQENPNGIELIGACPPGPCYLYYRPQRPVWTGSTWLNTNTYTAGTEVQYTSTSTGAINYWISLANTLAGQSPDTVPSKWSIVPVPYLILQYCVHNAYADWLQTEGQTAKAQLMYQYAQTCLDDENDRQERQAGNIQPWRVATHITSQNRSMGWGGYNFGNSNQALLGN